MVTEIYHKIPETPGARLFLWEGAALFIGPLSDTTQHRHHAAQVSIGLSGSFRIRAGSRWQGTDYACIPANYPHQVQCDSGAIAVALFDGATAPGRAIGKGGPGTTARPLAPPPAIPGNIGEAKQFLDFMISPFCVQMTAPKPLDERIATILSILADPETAQIRTKNLAREVGLSEGRFMHLFKDETGLPVRRYVLWRRIIKSVDAASHGADMTTAAHAGGFSDSAHFSRIFRATFGLSPSKLFKNSRNIQVTTSWDG